MTARANAIISALGILMLRFRRSHLHRTKACSDEIESLLISARPRESGDPYVDGPRLARGVQRVNRSDCDHMYGLLTRPYMTAAKMGSATRVPNRGRGLEPTTGSLGVSRIWIDRSHHLSFSSKLRPQRTAKFRRHAEEL